MGRGAIETSPCSDLAHRQRRTGAQQQFDDRQGAVDRLHGFNVGRRASTAMRIVRMTDSFIQLVRHATIVSPRVV